MSFSGFQKRGVRAAEAVRDAVASFVDDFYGELVAYGREVLLYPLEHPRLVARTRSLSTTIVSFVADRGRAVTIQVREGTIYSDNEPIESEAATKLAILLRERMIQLIRILPQVTVDEAQDLANFFAFSDKPVLGASRECHIGQNVFVYRFPLSFSEGEDHISEEDVIAQAQQDSGQRQEAPDVQGGWTLFSKEQLRAVDEVLSSNDLRRQLEYNSALQPGGGDFDGFIERFFEILRSDPRMNWKNSDNLRESVQAGLDLIEECRRLQRLGTAHPAHLLSVSKQDDDPLGPSLRWQMMRHFVPGDLLPPDPREELDLADLVDKVTNPGLASSRSAARARKPRWRPDFNALRAEFEEYFGGLGFLCEYTTVATELVFRNEENERAITRRYLEIVDTVNGKRADRDTLTTLLYTTNQLPRKTRVRWQAKIIRSLAEPDAVLDVLSGENQLLLEEIIESPPVPLNSPRVDSDDDLAPYVEVLRQVLVRGDDYAMDLAFSVLSGPKRGLALKGGWDTLLKELAGMHRALQTWVQRHADELCRKEATFVLAALPYRQLHGGLRASVQTANEREQLRFIAALERLSTPQATRLLTIAFGFRSASVRRVALGTLANQRNAVAFKILCDLLKEKNEGRMDMDEVDQICSLMVRCRGDEGRAFLNRVRRERKGLSHRWRSVIRKAAKHALEWETEDKTTSPGSRK